MQRYFSCTKPAENQVEEIKFLNANYKGWIYLPHRSLKADREGSCLFIILTDPHGITLEFNVTAGQTKMLTEKYGISNLSGDMPSGKNDIRNIRIEIQNEETCIIVKFPDGIKRYYQRDPSKNLKDRYFLDKEVLPNGKVLKYHYDNRKLVSISATDLQERYAYSSISIEGDICKNSSFTSNSGQKTFYNYETRRYDIKTKHKHQSSHYIGGYPSVLTSVCSPFFQNETICHDNRLLLSEVNSKDNFFRCSYSRFGQEP